MAFILLWIEVLIAVLLLAATLFACTGRVRRTWLRRILSSLVLLAVALPVAGLLIPAWTASRHLGAPGRVVYGFAGLAAACFVGWLIIARLARNRSSGESVTGSATWSCWKLAVSFGVALGLSLITYWNLDLAARQRVAALRTRIAAMIEAAAPRPVPDEDNAAPLYKEAHAFLGPRDFWPEGWRKWFSDDDVDVTSPAITAFLRRNAPALELTRRAAARRECNFDLPYSEPSYHMALPNVGQIRTPVRLLLLNARSNLETGDTAAALDDLQAALNSTDHVAREPLIVCVSAGVLTEADVIDFLEKSLDQFSPDQVASLKIGGPPRWAQRFENALEMDQPCGLSVLFEFGSGNPYEDGYVIEISRGMGLSGGLIDAASFYRIFLLGDDVLTYSDIMYDARSLCDSIGSYGCSDGVFDRANQLEERIREMPEGLVKKAVFDDLVKHLRWQWFADARRLVTQTGLAAYRFRAEEGRFPDDVRELCPKYLAVPPRDPFYRLFKDARPAPMNRDPKAAEPPHASETGFLKLKKTEDGLIVYSVGPDGFDDWGTDGFRGVDRNKLRFDERGDITFRVAEPKER